MSHMDANALAVVCAGILSDNAATVRRQLIDAGRRRQERDDTYRLLYGGAHIGQRVVVVKEMYCEDETFAPRVVDDAEMFGRIVKAVQRPPSVHYIEVVLDQGGVTLEFDLTTLVSRSRNMR